MGNKIIKIKLYKRINLLIYILFIFIVTITIIIGYNTWITNSKVKEIISQLTFYNQKYYSKDSNILKIPDDSLNSDEYKNQFVTLVKDTISTIPKLELYDKAIFQLKNTKEYILNANTISYFFQTIAILVIGLGLFLGLRINKYIEEVSKFESKIQEIQNTNTLIRFCESINYFSLPLKPDTLIGGIYNSENMKLCHLISRKSEETKEFIEDNQIYRITNEQEKKLLSELISDVKLKFDTMGLSKIDGYYKNIYSIIDELFKIIQRLKYDLT